MKKVLIVKTGTTFADVRDKAGDFDDMVISRVGLERDDVSVCPVYLGEALPPPKEFRAAIITGSHDNVTDMAPWALALKDWVGKKAYGNVPLLGICYGHQLMAVALGGSADFHPRGIELGTVEIELTPEGRADPLMLDLPDRFPAHATHAQTVTVLPAGARVLAHNRHERHHALSFGKMAWGLQFHPEYPADVVRMYIGQARHVLEKLGYDTSAMLDGVRESPWGETVLKRFLELSGE